ncbi:unknown protein [Seminavis robusta]|uniref:Uncharacterized protein n=1 Tax=Seminavis robusta TaxID=568900 RepID=A0A9N8F3X0_9STRA|nr:unknown protein [Seminavis robusta]|eukprot:Sro3368_g347290.1 n/a (233) ;mRNA; r:953-1651
MLQKEHCMLFMKGYRIKDPIPVCIVSTSELKVDVYGKRMLDDEANMESSDEDETVDGNLEELKVDLYGNMKLSCRDDSSNDSSDDESASDDGGGRMQREDQVYEIVLDSSDEEGDEELYRPIFPKQSETVVVRKQTDAPPATKANRVSIGSVNNKLEAKEGNKVESLSSCSSDYDEMEFTMKFLLSHLLYLILIVFFFLVIIPLFLFLQFGVIMGVDEPEVSFNVLGEVLIL